MAIPTDYKRTYETYDGVAVDPYDEVWVCKPDIQTPCYVPVSFTALEAERAGERIYYSTYEACEDACYDANL